MPSRASVRACTITAAVVSSAALIALCLMIYSSPRDSSKPEVLYQINDQEFLDMKTGSLEDVAMEVSKELAQEKILLSKIDKRAKDHQRVEIKIVAGQIGPRGLPGPVGYPGPKGFEGSRGLRGPRGPVGDVGPQGPQGPEGPKGDDGNQGPDGDTGDQGPQGPAGPAGREGREGPRGAEGALGRNGPPGPPGQNGPMGPPGLSAFGLGPQGPSGPPGPPGPNGLDGVPGQRGPKGPRGEQGLDGRAGNPGPEGPAGNDGKSVCGLRSLAGENLCCGVVDANKFVQGNNELIVPVDSTKCGFTAAPKYFTTLSNVNDGPRFVYSQADIRTSSDPTKGFRGVLRSTRPYNLGQAQSMKWKLNWCGVGPSSLPPRPYAMCCGVSTANWESWDAGWSSHMVVDTSGCGWSWGKDADRLSDEDRDVLIPMYFTSVADSASGSASRYTGTGSTYHPAPNNFHMFIFPYSGMPPAYDKSRQSEFRVNWCGLKVLPPIGEAAAAGFPCTAPKLLVGGTNQNTYSNQGNICCGVTDSSNWRDFSDGIRIFKMVDLSKCALKGVRVLLTDLIGDDDVVLAMGGSTSWSVTSNPNEVQLTLYPTNTGFRAFGAERYNFRVQYCAIGA